MKFSWSIFLILVFVEILSFLSSLAPLAQAILLPLFCLTVFIIALADLKKGLLIALAELFIGGFGYLFAWRMGGLNFSLRMGLFVAILAAALFQISKEKKLECFHSKFYTAYAWFIIFLLLGLWLGYKREYLPTALLFDSNAFLFLALLAPLYQAFKTKQDLKEIWPVFGSAALWLSIKTLLVFVIFVSGFSDIGSLFYKWIRDSGVGEITSLGGGIFRVFFQSQIFLVFALLLLTAERLFESNANKKSLFSFYLPTTLLFSALAISFSRSFWLGLIISAGALLFASLIFLRVPFRKFLSVSGQIFLALAAGLTLISLLVIVFHPQHRPWAFLASSENRASSSDASANTRLTELPPLWRAIREHWLFGHGFGKTLTFKSQDPRVLSTHPGGEYTTYAFEWGWLDLWLKIGLAGAATLLFLLYKIFKIYLRHIKYNFFNLNETGGIGLETGMAACLLALVIIHFFTPYLNHPLGLGWLILTGLLIDKKRALS
ncbi:MAG: O-antigen ligase family protein [Candidatus Magasanikbacteria bacterium]|nr:O-antigen ligase family protein [Candidatus Magasanikbacteria bacterium]